MTTRAALITERYTALEAALKPYFADELFPSLADIDLSDLVYFVVMTFIGVDSDEQYRDKIESLIATKTAPLSPAARDVVVPLVRDFVRWLKCL